MNLPVQNYCCHFPVLSFFLLFSFHLYDLHISWLFFGKSRCVFNGFWFFGKCPWSHITILKLVNTFSFLRLLFYFWSWFSIWSRCFPFCFLHWRSFSIGIVISADNTFYSDGFFLEIFLYWRRFGWHRSIRVIIRIEQALGFIYYPPFLPVTEFFTDGFSSASFSFLAALAFSWARDSS